MSMDGLGRALRYFIRQAEIYVALIIAGSFALAYYQRFVLGESMSFTSIMQIIPGIVVSLTALIMFINAVSDRLIWGSILISFGCCRKNVFLGTLIMNLLIMIESLIFFEIMSMILRQPAHRWILPLFAFYLFVEGISQLIGAMTVKWGKIVYVLSVLMIVIFAVVIGMLKIIVFDLVDVQAELFSKVTEPIQQCWIALIGMLICAAANAVSYHILSSFEVKT